MFSCGFCEISKNAFFTEHLQWLLLSMEGEQRIFFLNRRKQKMFIVFIKYISYYSLVYLVYEQVQKHEKKESKTELCSTWVLLCVWGPLL